jgi:hypothetical protein
MNKKKMTIAGLQAAKKKGIQLTQMYAGDADSAAACEAAGIDIICTLRENGEEIGKAAVVGIFNTFLPPTCSGPIRDTSHVMRNNMPISIVSWKKYRRCGLTRWQLSKMMLTPGPSPGLNT